jgi:hypothetical protein
MSAALEVTNGLKYLPDLLKEPDDEALQAGALKLDNFIQSQAIKFGLGPIQLATEKYSDTICADPKEKTVFLGMHHIREYGEPVTEKDLLIRSMPDKPEELRAYLLGLSPEDFRNTRKLLEYYTHTSDLELEAILCHELGHIALKHERSPPMEGSHEEELEASIIEELHTKELDADRYACCTNESQMGIVQFFKRKIIKEILTLGQYHCKNMDHAAYDYTNSDSHPSVEVRLNLALEMKPLA